MPNIKKRRLHVWESPQLHPSEKQLSPVHLAFDDHEYDWWRFNGGNLEVGWTIERGRDKATGEPLSIEYHVFYVVAAGMYAKVNEEWYEEEAENDRGSAALGRARDEELEDPHVAASLPARARFSRQPNEANQTVPAEVQETTVIPKIDGTRVTLEKQEQRIDPVTGVNLSAISSTVQGRPVSPAPTMLLGPIPEHKGGDNDPGDDNGLAETRLDLTSPEHNSGR